MSETLEFLQGTAWRCLGEYDQRLTVWVIPESQYHWLFDGEDVVCLYCHKPVAWMITRGHQVHWDYCGECGAGICHECAAVTGIATSEYAKNFICVDCGDLG